MLLWLKQYSKAIFGAIIAGLGAAKLAATEGFTAQEIIEILIVTIGALGVIWGVPNQQRTTEEEEEQQ